MSKILLVDDNPDLRDFFSQLLQLHGFDIATAASKCELYKTIQHYCPNLIMMDIRVGNDDGREICKDLKSILHKTPVILLSASPELLHGYQNYCADDVLEKPFEIEEVITKVKKHLGIQTAA